MAAPRAISRTPLRPRLLGCQFSPDRTWCLRRVLSSDGTEVLLKEVVHLDGHPRCSCGITDHTAIATDKLEALQRTTERLLPPEALRDLERESRSQPEEVNERQYDGGYLPGSARRRPGQAAPRIRRASPPGAVSTCSGRSSRRFWTCRSAGGWSSRGSEAVHSATAGSAGTSGAPRRRRPAADCGSTGSATASRVCSWPGTSRSST